MGWRAIKNNISFLVPKALNQQTHNNSNGFVLNEEMQWKKTQKRVLYFEPKGCWRQSFDIFIFNVTSFFLCYKFWYKNIVWQVWKIVLMPHRHNVKMTEHHVIQRFISNSFLSVQSLESNVHCHFLQKSVTLSDGISVVRTIEIQKKIKIKMQLIHTENKHL